ncbi:hypothetical protein NQ318_006618 [Aromia moschata]|uniref:Uncharacterized protein n=1 Tax=Aromia moschata TaxID=1265417 RepID=A0AAV8XH04_9CUCU|nr:hypothetical protein NQ318_006618 [Aromia moschata]
MGETCEGLNLEYSAIPFAALCERNLGTVIGIENWSICPRLMKQKKARIDSKLLRKEKQEKEVNPEGQLLPHLQGEGKEAPRRQGRGDLQLRPAPFHPHVVGEGGGKEPPRGLPVRQVEGVTNLAEATADPALELDARGNPIVAATIAEPPPLLPIDLPPLGGDLEEGAAGNSPTSTWPTTCRPTSPICNNVDFSVSA